MVICRVAKCKNCKHDPDIIACTINANYDHHSIAGKPSMVFRSGRREWHKNGSWHRKNGPACIDSDGDKTWCLDGSYHRTSGPAIDWEGHTEWYLYGSKYTEEAWNKEKQADKAKRKKKSAAPLERGSNHWMFALVLIPVILLGLWIKN